MNNLLVTGGGSGIGLAVVKQGLKDGYAVASLDCLEPSFELIDELESIGPDFHSYCVDVSNEQALKKAFSSMFLKMGYVRSFFKVLLGNLWVVFEVPKPSGNRLYGLNLRIKSFHPK